MKRYITVLLFSVLASICWTGCFPDDYLDDQPVVAPPKPDPDPEPQPDPEPEPEPDPEPEDGLNYDNLSAYGPLKSYVNRAVSPDFKMGAAVYVNDFLNKSKMYNVAVELKLS